MNIYKSLVSCYLIMKDKFLLYRALISLQRVNLVGIKVNLKIISSMFYMTLFIREL